MLDIKRGNASGKQLRSFFFSFLDSPPEIADSIITSFLGISKAGKGLVIIVRTLRKSG